MATRTKHEEKLRGASRHRSAVAAVRAEKAARGNRCEDCGQVYHYFQLDFAHRNEFRHLKEPRMRRQGFGLSALARMNMARFIRELAICRLLCANCHRLETYRGKHWVLDEQEDEDDPQGALF